MILKEYQQQALAIVSNFCKELATWREKEEEARSQNPDWGFDWSEKAWSKSKTGRPYYSRCNGLEEPLPAFCIKVPTGGGKTLLAIRVIDLINIIYRRSQRGLVLWIVPTTQIYNQTLKALKDRDHPYRQQLDISSGQRTLILEKNTVFSPRDIDENLCILLLMLPSANRQMKETLHIFRDSGGFSDFFPTEDTPDVQAKLLDSFPNLDTFEQAVNFWGRVVKTSLGNTIRVLRPLIILDEGHKAYSINAKATLEGFNPCMIVELSATPANKANVLVEILGRELNAEEMIKLDMHIYNRVSGDWQDTLLESVEHRERLEVAAKEHEASSGTYIRPICVIQVERTGQEQRKPGFVHTDDVREYLLQHPGIAPEHIAVKTSSKDELKELDDVGGLMSRTCPVRFVITKQALQEGWDCPFAYVLTILANPSSKTGLTQLVGRILRQPYACKTGVASLDESYVFCYSRKGADILKEVRQGFGLEGLQGLEGRVLEDKQNQDVDSPETAESMLTTRQREEFQASASGLVLPAFMIKDTGDWRLVHYEADILSRLTWEQVDLAPLLESLQLDKGRGDGQHIRAGFSVDELSVDELSVDEHSLEYVVVQGSNRLSSSSNIDDCGRGDDPIDYFLAASHLLDVVPNPWLGRELASYVFLALRERYSLMQVTANYAFVLKELRQHLEKERDRLSSDVFHELLASGEMRFIVVAEHLRFNRLPNEIKVPKVKQANRDDGSHYQHNLFDATVEEDLNQLENTVATYLDHQARLFFWYRNRARKDYYVQGWKPRRIYADFIVTLRDDAAGTDDSFQQVFVVETKGIHLKGSEDTEYKRTVFNICTEYAHKADWAEFVPAMRNKALRFEVVHEDEWQTRLNQMLFP